MFKQESKEKSSELCGENTALFDAIADFECPRRSANEIHYSVHVTVEGLGHALLFMLVIDIWRVKMAYSEFNEIDGKVCLLLSALRLELSHCQMEKSMSNIDLSARKTFRLFIFRIQHLHETANILI